MVTTGLDILVVDDHQLFADVLALQLSDTPGIESVRTAYSIDQARRELTRSAPDAVLLDFQLEDRTALDLLRWLRTLDKAPTALVISASSDPERVIQAVAEGASGWVIKASPFEGILDGLSEVSRGNLYIPPSVLRPVFRRLLSTWPGIPRQSLNFVDSLTPRQNEILRCLVAGLDRTAIAERLGLSTNTVRTHVQHLMQRSGLHTTLALVAEARRLGVTAIGPSHGDVHI